MYCQCGIHAFKAAEQLGVLLGGPVGGRVELVLGEVYLWGTVVEHKLGWRAQFAYPKRLVVLPDMPKEHIQTLVAYGVEISVTALNQLAAAWVDAIANHDFEKARFFSDHERKERENLNALREKYHVEETAAIGRVTREDIEHVVADWTGLPIETIRQSRGDLDGHKAED